VVSRFAIALLDFGGPQRRAELVPFLSELLADVLPGPSWFSGPLGAVIARFRARSVAPMYASIGWSPLVPTHFEQARGLADRVEVPVVSGMMFTDPHMSHTVQQLLELDVDGVIALPMFPHYSLATTHAAFGFFQEALAEAGRADLPVHWVNDWFDHDGYIDALAQTIREGVENTPGDGALHLLFTPHGLPESFVRRGDPYPGQVQTTVDRVLERLDWNGPSHLGWQSRVGPAKWLSPSTPERLEEIAKGGGTRVCLVPVSFVSEHIETLFEIDVEYRHEADQLGIPHWGRAPALGTSSQFLDTLAALATEALRDFSPTPRPLVTDVRRG